MREPAVPLARLYLDNAALPTPHQAVSAIQDLILTGEIKPRQRLPSQRDLSRMLGVSRASLREATSILETLGLVRASPGRGVFVVDQAKSGDVPHWRFGARYSEEEVYQLRMCIEPELAALSALRADATQLLDLHQTVGEQREAFGEGNLAIAAECDRRFHAIICLASGNRMLSEIYGNMARYLEESQRRPMIRGNRKWETIQEHEAILRAIGRRNAQLAHKRMRQHIQGAASRIGISVISFVP
jgi:GntR family transcriptional regulator, transcriptional repressor for pyruvate dehydrogenase complex